jgi:hypothetical protein
MPTGIYKRIKKWKLSAQTILNQRIAHQGKKHNLGTHWKVKDTSKYTGANGFKKGNKTNVGKHLSKEHKEKIGNAHRGERCNWWIDGRSIIKNEYSPAWTKELRQAIRQRDKFICVICDNYPSTSVHHIDYNKMNCEPENLIVLCKGCHVKTNFNRKNWIDYFNRLIV